MTNKRREAPIRIIIRKKGHGGAAHGGAWKVAFADFMTAMFCLFLVLWIVNQSSDVKSAIAGYFQDPLGRADEYGSSIMPGEGQYASTPRVLSERDVLSLRRDRLQRLGDDIEEKLSGTPAFEEIREHVDISLTEDGLRIELLEDSSGVFFETGRPNLSTHGREILELLGAELGTLPNFVRIEGHTDAYPFRGDATYTNWELSADRANTARRIMTSSGLRVEQITQVTGFAERQPRVVQDPYSPRNRRITITMLLGEATRRPGDPGAVKPREAEAP